MKNEKGETLEKTLEKMDYKGTFQRSLHDVEYMLELHVEQGSVLYSGYVSVGVVDNITGLAWIMASILGEENHSGTTPMIMRKGALVAASEFISFVSKRAEEMIEKFRSSIVGTVGKMDVYPNGTNIIPGMVELGIDIRDTK